MAAAGSAAFRRVCPGCCPACERGGVAPTVEDCRAGHGRHDKAKVDLGEVLALFAGLDYGPTLIGAAASDCRW